MKISDGGMNINRARTLAEEAKEWPRCGRDWPRDDLEALADRLIWELDPEYAEYFYLASTNTQTE